MPARSRQRPALRWIGDIRLACLTWAVCLAIVQLVICGCQTIRPRAVVDLPRQYSVKSHRLTVLSDFRLANEHPLIQELDRLREQVRTVLHLPEQRDSVIVYMFADEQTYRRYLAATWPGLPPRRAYFVGTPRELAVYTFWGDKIQEDLRHEYTHGILHACLQHVPLWLDEGLAEYFEVPGIEPGNINSEYTTGIAELIATDWRPDINRLESLSEFATMKRADYQEAWAWVHYLMHGSPDLRDTLITYVNELRDSDSPPLLSQRIAEIRPSFQEHMLSYIATLNGATRIASTDPIRTASARPGH